MKVICTQGYRNIFEKGEIYHLSDQNVSGDDGGGYSSRVGPAGTEVPFRDGVALFEPVEFTDEELARAESTPVGETFIRDSGDVYGIQADRHNDGKPRLSMVLEARNALNLAAEVFEAGAKKYDRSNWRKGLPHTQICDSLLRHLTAYLSGETHDPETGVHHAGHILTNAIFLAEFAKEERFDDRP